MFSRPAIAISVLLLGGIVVAALVPAQARKKPKPTPTPSVTSTPSATSIPTATPTPEKRESDAIYEAALLSSLVPRNTKVYVLLDGEIPAPAFRERMAQQHILLSDVPPPRTLRHDMTPPHFGVSKPKWISDSQVEVYWNDAGSGSLFTLEKKEDKWTVTKRTLVWIR